MEIFHPRTTTTTTTMLLLLLFISILLPLTSQAPAITTENYFWHVTDFHMDLNYTKSGNAYRMCWENNETPSASPMGSFGDYRCDSPYQLVQSAVQAMYKLGPKPDFVLWTGDDKAHVSDSFFDPDIVLSLVTNLTETLNKTFPDVPFVPVLGNHDWYPTHQLPPKQALLYEKIGTLWKPWIKDSGYETFRRGGYYSLRLPNDVRFVVLNTALYYRKNNQVTLEDSKSDPGGQFEWFDQQMTDVKSKNQKVYVTSHVPPGVFERHIQNDGFQWLSPLANQKLVQLVVKHGESIAGLFFAHHHTDSFRVFYDDNGKPVSFMLIAPAVTPWNTTLSQVGPNNPGLRKVLYNPQNQEVSTSPHLRSRDPAIRLLHYSPQSGQIETFQQYFLNLSKANQKDSDEWELEYDAREAYGIDSISPENLDQVVTTFNTTDRTLFDLYYLYNSVSYQPANECDTTCRLYHFCVITNVDYSSFSDCQRLHGLMVDNGARGKHYYNTAQTLPWLLLVLVFSQFWSLLGILIT